MSKPKIKLENLPMRSPLIFTIVMLLALDRLNAPGWGWGVAITFIVLVWFAFITEICTARFVDLLANK